jgi:hypothetical protein
MPPQRLFLVLVATHKALELLLCLLEQIRPRRRFPQEATLRTARSLRLWHTTNLGQYPHEGVAPRLRASLSMCARGGEQTSGLAEEASFSDIARGHPYHFGGRSSQSPQSLPHRTHPCQGAAAAVFASCATRSRDAFRCAQLLQAREAVQNPLEEPHYSTMAIALCQVNRRDPIRVESPSRHHGFARADRER